MRFRRWLVVVLLFAATIGCDRVTKHMAAESLAGAPTRSFLADTFRLTYAENAGGFLSLGAGLAGPLRTTIFTIGTGVALLVLFALSWRAGWQSWRTVGLSLFIAGGVSNWFDRLVGGHVVDFLNVGVGWLRTGVFNVADMAVMLGVALFLLGDLRSKKPAVWGLGRPRPLATERRARGLPGLRRRLLSRGIRRVLEMRTERCARSLIVLLVDAREIDRSH